MPLAGLKVRMSRPQMRKMEMMQTGRATKNQTSQLGSGDMFSKAMMFCGEAIGEAAPPIFEARAMPRMRALEKLESEGRLRSRGLLESRVSSGSWILFTRKGKGRRYRYLNDRVAEDRSSDIAYPHTGDHCHEHVGNEHDVGLRACLAEYKGGHELCNVIL